MSELVSELENGLGRQEPSEVVVVNQLTNSPTHSHYSRTKFASVAPMPSIVDFAFQRSLPL